jgi:hypothetical protein
MLPIRDRSANSPRAQELVARLIPLVLRIKPYFKDFQSKVLVVVKTDTLTARALIGFAFFLYFVYFAIESNKARTSESPWNYGEWLISYASGFQRRGLFGSFILGVADFLELNPLWVIFALQILGFAILLVMLFRKLTRQNLPVVSLIAVFSPMALCYSLVDEAVVGRKEMFLYILCLAWFEFCKNQSGYEIGKEFFVKSLIFSTSFFILLLTHEGLAVFLPLLLTTLFVSRFVRGEISNHKFHFGIVTLAAPLILIAITIALFPQETSVAELCAPIISAGITETICTGAIDWSVRSGTEGLGYAIVQLGLLPPTYFNYFPAAIATLSLPVAALWICARPTKKGSTQFRQQALAFFTFITAALVLTLPLYIIAFDWGRYLSISATILAFATPYVATENKLGTTLKKAHTQLKQTVPNHWAVTLGVVWLLVGISHYGGEYSSIGSTIAQLIFVAMSSS